MAAEFTICVLGYDTYADLLRRCLGSIYSRVPDLCVAEIRVGLNKAQDVLCQTAEEFLFNRINGSLQQVVPARLIVDRENEPKYPMMRRLFYDIPIQTEFVMWFDDDSFIRPTAPADFFRQTAVEVSQLDFRGKRYRITKAPGQMEWLRAQPWFTPDAQADADRMFQFCTGGWWVGRTRLLRQWNYPWPELRHNGGDVMLGQLARCQRWRRNDGHVPHVAINADAEGRESKADRRGLNTSPIGRRGPTS